MSDDILSRATRALREETRGDDASARFTRSRIMASAHEQRVKRRTRLAFLLPIAATFMAATAWGAANGKIGQAFDAMSEALGIMRHHEAPPAPAPKAPATRPSATTPALKPLTPPLEAPAPLAPEPEPEPAPAPRVAAVPAPSVERTLSGATASSSGSAGSGSRDPALELYRVAHQAHFVERDSGRALSAWDAYLKAAPNGALALEARYNRALCLVRLHRTTEARAALTPFAAGRFGGYRKKEASDLLAALPAELPGPGE